MKSQGKFLLLLGVVIGVVGYAAYDYYSEQQNDKRHADETHLLKFDKAFTQDQIAQIEISHGESGGTPPIHLQRTPQGWKITQPVQELADLPAVDDYLSAVINEQSKDLVSEGKDIDWKLFGLDHPKATLTFALNSGAKCSIDVSDKKNFAGDSYLRIQGLNKVYIGASSWWPRANKSLYEFRNKHLLKKDAANIQDFKLSGPAVTPLQLNKKEGQWILAAHPDWKMDTIKVDELMGALNSMNALQFNHEGAITSKELQAYGLHRPQFSIEYSGKDKFNGKILFAETTGKNKEKSYYAQIFEPAQVLQLAPGDYEKFSHLQAENLRDRTLPFHFDKSAVKKILVHSSASIQAEFRLIKDVWQLQNEDSMLQYQKDRPASILALVHNLEAMDFHPVVDSTAKKMGTGVEFLDGDGKSLLKLQFLQPYHTKVNGVVKNNILVQSSQLTGPVGVDETAYHAIDLESVVKPAPAKKEKN